MQLYGSTTSPFVRKVRVAAHLLKLSDQLEFVPEAHTKHLAKVTAGNPLGLIPVLFDEKLGKNKAVIDSQLIVEYLQIKADNYSLVPKDPLERIMALRLALIADGATDAYVLRHYENMRSDNEKSPSWIEKMKQRIHRSLDALEDEADVFQQTNIISINVLCLCGGLAFRDPAFDLFSKRPRIKAIVDKLNEDPFIESSKPFA